MNKDHGQQLDPYRILFPMGILAALVSLILWILFQNEGISFYPRVAHANLMFFGFFWSFVAGFLMTAVPRMTGAPSASWREIAFAVILVFLQLAFNIRDATDFAVYLYVLQNISLIVFLLRRFLVKKHIPFEGFVFVPFAFFQSFVGVWLWTQGHSSALFLLCGEAFILNLIFGLGSRLIPVLSRVPNALAPDTKSKMQGVPQVFVWALLLNLAFYLQLAAEPIYGLALKFFVLSFFAVRKFQLFARSSSLSFLGLGLRLSIVFMLVSTVLQMTNLFQALAAQHLFYIGGLLMLTLMVATRVMLAHGGQSLDYELRSKRIMGILLLLGVAALLRLSVASDLVSFGMKASLYIVIAGLLLWIAKFAKILYVPSRRP